MELDPHEVDYKTILDDEIGVLVRFRRELAVLYLDRVDFLYTRFGDTTYKKKEIEDKQNQISVEYGCLQSRLLSRAVGEMKDTPHAKEIKRIFDSLPRRSFDILDIEKAYCGEQEPLRVTLFKEKYVEKEDNHGTDI